MINGLRKFEVKYSGDPELQPICSYENPALVRLLYKISTHLNEKVYVIFRLKLRANGCNNSRQYWDLQCIVGRIQPIRLWRPCAMRVRGPNNVGRASAVQTDPTLLRYASTITVQKKCWELWAQTFDRFQTCNRVCKRTQHVTSNNREFTRRQRWQQREWQKSNRFI